MAQGPEGIAMASYSAVLGSEDGIVLNAYEALDCTFTTPGGERAKLSLRGGYPWKGEVSVSLELPSPEIFTIRFRIPFWWKGASSFRLNGETLAVVPGEYLELKRQWRNTDRIMITFDLTAEMVSSPDLSHTGYLAGPIVLAQDSRLGTVGRPMPDELPVSGREPGFLRTLRFSDGSGLCDYASAGNRFSPDHLLQLWLKTIPPGKSHSAGSPET